MEYRRLKAGAACLLGVLLACLPLSGCASQPEASKEEGLTVYTSFYPMYDFTAKIAGDNATVVNMAPTGGEVHDWEPTAREVTGLQNAAVFVYSGAGMEHWVDSVLAALGEEGPLAVEASRGLELLTDEHGHDGEHEEEHDDDGDSHDGHDHGGVDPHVWLNPLNAKHQMEKICDALIAVDPANEEDYRKNYEAWAAQLEILDDEFRQALEPLENRHIVVSHKAFGYLCEAYGIEQLAAMDYSPEGEPTPAQMASLVSFARENPIRTVFYEAQGSDKVAAAIAREIGADTAALYPLEALSPEQEQAGEDYFSVMRRNLEALCTALE